MGKESVKHQGRIKQEQRTVEMDHQSVEELEPNGKEEGILEGFFLECGFFSDWSFVSI